VLFNGIFMSKRLNKVMGVITSYRSLNNVLGDIKLINKEQELKLIDKVQIHGDVNAIEKLSFNYLRMVGKLADGFAKSDENFQELFQAACVGMIESFYSFKKEKSTRLSTYVTIYANKEIYRHIQENHRIVNIGKYGSSQGRLFYNVDKYTDEEGNVNTAALSKKFNMSTKLVDEYVIVRKGSDTTIDIASDSEDDFNKVQLGSDQHNIEKLFTEGTYHLPYQQKAIDNTLKKLSDKHSTVIIERWLSGESNSLEEIAKKMNYSRQHIHTLESEALKKMKKYLNREDV